MNRNKKLLLISHCILNQNAVIKDGERAEGAFYQMKDYIDEGIGLIQLPCPEMIFGGVNRPPATYEDYNTADYRSLCQSLMAPYITQIREYLKHRYELTGLIGIQNSPTCSISTKRGVFMEEFLQALHREGITPPLYEIPDCVEDLRIRPVIVDIALGNDR